MKFPKHVLLDIRSNFLLYTNQYWIQHFFLISEESVFFKKTRYFFKFLLLRNTDKSRPFSAKGWLSPFIKNYLSTNKKSKNLINITNFIKQNKLNKNSSKKRTKRGDRFNLKFFAKEKSNFANSFQSLFVINFLKKEKLYTKLKYSRVPQYDSVSGGSAALLAGFLGFLICEKFGFELLDSGDFYFFFMYAVFFLFFLGLLLKITSVDSYYWDTINFKSLWMFYYTHALLIFKTINNVRYR